jgi:hypothetical protein
LPATALAAGESLTVTPSNLQAGGATDVTETLTFASGENPKTVVTSLAPGLLDNLNADPGCVVAQRLTPSCQIGTGSASIIVDPSPTPTPIPGNLYLVPPQGTDVAGIESVPPAATGVPNQYTGVTLNPNAPGGLNLTTTFNPLPGGVQLQSLTANFTTLNGQAFTRLPSSCAAATSTFSVTYDSGATGSASAAFTPTGCSSLAYAPKLSATITKDTNDSGAAMVIGITQAATESASKSIVLQLPKGLQPNATGDLPCPSAAGCKIGTATATSPLIPNAVLANGTVTLSGNATTPNLAIAFQPPFAITINGTVSLANNSVTFASVPDVPLTDLKLSITGPSGGKAFNTDCVPANIGGTFTPQSGAAAVPVTSAIKFSNCALKPTATGSTGGLASGHPKLEFNVTHGQGAGNIASLAIGLPAGGLKFSRSAFVSHKTCAKPAHGKKKCTTTTLIKGLGVSGGAAKSVALEAGKLVITLKKPASRVTITVSGPLVAEVGSLQQRVKKHKVKSLLFVLQVRDAKATRTTIALQLKPH